MIAKVGAILSIALFSNGEPSLDDGVSLLALRQHNLQSRRSICPVSSTGSRTQVFHGVEDECRDVMESVEHNGGDCPDGYMVILDQEECHKACAELFDTPSYLKFNHSNIRRPNGCFTRKTTQPGGNCHFNINWRGGVRPAWLDSTKSICMKTSPNVQHIKVVATTDTDHHSQSNGNFYISFPGDQKEYPLSTSADDDFKNGATDVFPLTVLGGADLSKPTIKNKQHPDGWQIASLKITDEDGGDLQVFHGFPIWVDGNCGTTGFYGNTPCSTEYTLPLKPIKVVTKTTNTYWAGTDGSTYIKFEGDHRKYHLDNPSVNDFKRGHTNVFAITVTSEANLHRPTVAIESNDGWHAESIEILVGPNFDQTLQLSGHQFPLWLDGNCDSSSDCSNSWSFQAN